MGMLGWKIGERGEMEEETMGTRGGSDGSRYIYIARRLGQRGFPATSYSHKWGGHEAPNGPTPRQSGRAWGAGHRRVSPALCRKEAATASRTLQKTAALSVSHKVRVGRASVLLCRVRDDPVRFGASHRVCMTVWLRL